MDDAVITVENLGKRYHLGVVQHDTLRDRLAHALRAPLNRLRGAVPADPTEFWALRGINFTVKRGEVLGIIGRNGAGKSTLLKILSRITEPTMGRVRIRGRVASLLEVGTGFHPELSGRENIFLNGAILGMSRAEIRRKFDEIIAFAEIERFLDTPVKHYSSGMYVRLAFAVAAHLEPEILIVDEVLAVGDAAFQKKCLGKMQDVAAGDGRTVLFVSHNMAAMQHLCTRGVLLQQGELVHAGAIDRTVAMYLNEVSGSGQPKWHYRHSNPWWKVTRIELRNVGESASGAIAGQALTIVVYYECTEPERFTRGISFSLTLRNEERKVANLWSEYQPQFKVVPGARGTIECNIPRWPFRHASFSVDLYAHVGNEPLEWIECVATFLSHDGDFYGAGRLTNSSEGFVFLPHHWSCHAGT